MKEYVAIGQVFVVFILVFINIVMIYVSLARLGNRVKKTRGGEPQ